VGEIHHDYSLPLIHLTNQLSRPPKYLMDTIAN